MRRTHTHTHTQVRVCNWELEPFVFYALKKVTLIVGVREVFSQGAMAGVPVHVDVTEPPQPPRPPVVKPEWCEMPSAYAQRIIDQLVDYVIQVRACVRVCGRLQAGRAGAARPGQSH